MDENTNVSAEIQEVAEPEMDEALESAENQEVAEPEASEESHEAPQSYGKTEQDAAFAEMRRQNQALENEKRMMMEALQRYFDGETAEELSINANAYAEQRDPDDYRAEWEHNQEFLRLQSENEALQDQLLNAEVDRLMREGLRDIQEIDPNVKSLDELGDAFGNFIRAGLSSKEAYYATKAMELKEKVFAPDAIGKVADTKAERDYFTEAELDALSDAELDKLSRDPDQWAKVMRSLERLPTRN